MFRQIPVWARCKTLSGTLRSMADGLQYDVLMYALTAAYISGAGELLASSIATGQVFLCRQPLACCCSLLCRWRGLCWNFTGRFI